MDFNWPEPELTVNGNVGIGTHTPSQELDVRGNSIIDGSLTINQNLTVSGNLQLGTLAVNEFSSDGNLADNSNLAVPTERAVKTYVDNNLDTKAALNGSSDEDFAANNLSVNDSLTVGNAIATKQLSVSDAVTGSLTIENNLTVVDKVGIGTTNPAQTAKLDVNGRLFLRDGLDFGGTAEDGYGTAGMISWRSNNNFVILGREGYGLQLGANVKSGSNLYALTIDTQGNVGIGTENPTAKLEVAGDIQASGKLSSQNGQVKRDFVTYHNTDEHRFDPIHIKTNIEKTSNYMYRILVEGYNFGVAAAINSDVVGYAYEERESIDRAQANNYADGVSISQYYSSDGYVVVKLTTPDTYFIGFSASAWFTNRNGNGFDISATVHHQANDL